MFNTENIELHYIKYMLSQEMPQNWKYACSIVLYRGRISSKLCSNSETNSSELLENFEEISLIVEWGL